MTNLESRLAALNNIKQILERNWKLAETKGYIRLLSRRETSRYHNLKNRVEQEIRQFEDEISSSGITKSNVEPVFSEILEERSNLDLPEWQKIQEFCEEVLAYSQCVEAVMLSIIEASTHPKWLLPTSTLSKLDFDLWEQFQLRQLQVEDIDRFFVEDMMCRGG